VTNVNPQLFDSVLAWLNKKGLNATMVVSFDEETVPGGTCGEGTCWYDDEIEITIKYLPRDGVELRTYEYEGDFGQLIRELTNE
jgi:hypothetical protein